MAVFARDIAAWWPGEAAPEVVVWDPPMRIGLRRPGAEAEVRFIELAPELTRVELENHGEAPAEGWASVLKRFAAACA